MAKPPSTIRDAIAAEVGASAAHYLRTMYPNTGGRAPSLQRSIRGAVAAVVAEAMALPDEAAARAWIDRRVRHRREIDRLHNLGDRAKAARGDAHAAEVVIAEIKAALDTDAREGER